MTGKKHVFFLPEKHSTGMWLECSTKRRNFLSDIKISKLNIHFVFKQEK